MPSKKEKNYSVLIETLLKMDMDRREAERREVDRSEAEERREVDRSEAEERR